MPMKAPQPVAMSTHRDDLESSGDARDGSDFGFTDDEDDMDQDDDDYYPQYDDEDEFSGSGDRGGSSQEVPRIFKLKPD